MLEEQQTEYAEMSAGLPFGAHSYTLPVQKMSVKATTGGAQAYLSPPASSECWMQNGAQVYDALPAHEVRAVPESHFPRIVLPPLPHTALPIAQLVIDAASYKCQEADDIPDVEPTMRMPARRSQQSVWRALVPPSSRLRRTLPFVVVALLTMSGVVALLRSRQPEAVSNSSVLPTVVSSASANNPEDSVVLSTRTLPPTRTSASDFHYGVVRPLPMTGSKISRQTVQKRMQHVAADTTPIIEPVDVPVGISHPKRGQTISRPRLSRSRRVTIVRQQPSVGSARTQIVTRSSQRPARPHPRTQEAHQETSEYDRDAEFKAELARHPEPGHDEATDKWMDKYQ